jgi:hypothetical protein
MSASCGGVFIVLLGTAALVGVAPAARFPGRPLKNGVVQITTPTMKIELIHEKSVNLGDSRSAMCAPALQIATLLTTVAAASSDCLPCWRRSGRLKYDCQAPALVVQILLVDGGRCACKGSTPF